MSSSPLVTVLVPARNEVTDIGGCLEAIAAQDHPTERLEVLVIDGGSTDGTGDRARQAMVELGLERGSVLANPVASTPSNLNVGLGKAGGSVVCRVDARTVIPSHYVRTCVEVLSGRPDVAVVGGAQVAVPRDRTARSVGIARALNNRYGMGLSRYRRGARSGESDTVYLGAFRTAELRAAGGWDERLPTNQDFELNRRMAERGLVWFEESLTCGYIPRRSLPELWRQYVRFGSWKVRYWRLTGDRPQLRQLALAGVPPVAGASALLWIARRPSPRRTVTMASAGLGALLLLEAVGAEEPEGDVAAHAYGAAAMAVVGAGWLTGLWRDLLATARPAVGHAAGTVLPATAEPASTGAER